VKLSNNWYCFNDQSVNKVDQDIIFKQRPYLLFYEKQIDQKRIRFLNNRKREVNNINNLSYIEIPKSPSTRSCSSYESEKGSDKKMEKVFSKVVRQSQRYQRNKRK
jgi:hypothetical protein